MNKKTQLPAILAIALLGSFATGLPEISRAADKPERSARRILSASGVHGGLVVHLGCDTGRLTAALHPGKGFLVQGLDKDREAVQEARRHIKAKGCYGQVTALHWRDAYLPYIDNVVNLLVCEDRQDMSMDEIMRVLAPGGTAYIKRANGWVKRVKPWPDDIDEWSHYLYDASNNAVSDDTEVAPPRGLQWTCGPTYCRSHEHFASLSAMVSAGGRVFYIHDKGPINSVRKPPEWHLVARDAFSGVVLWTRSIEHWESQLRGFRSGPPEIGRRIVARGDRVYAVLDYGARVLVLDAATGRTLHAIAGTEGAREILYHRGGIYVLADNMSAEDHRKRKEWYRKNVPRQGYRYPKKPIPMYGKQRIIACDAGSGEILWRDKDDRAPAAIMPATMAVAEDRLCFQTTTHVVCLDTDSGDELWRAERPVATSRFSWSTPTLVIQDGVVISGDRLPDDNVGSPPEKGSRWIMDSHHQTRKQPGEIVAFSLKTGAKLWDAPAFENYTIPMDIFVMDGVVWTGDIRARRHPGVTTGRSLRTGRVVSQLPRNNKLYNLHMGHNRCYRNKATTRYILLGRDGIELINPADKTGNGNWWVRGTCQYGIMPANGLIYAPPHSCACHIADKLTGFNVLSSAPAFSGKPLPASPRLEKGPAYGTEPGDPVRDHDGSWPTYRANPQRTGYQKATTPAPAPEQAWVATCTPPVTPPVVARGHVYVAEVDTHTLHALDVDSGDRKWSFVANGRIDSPPTVCGNLCVFGTRSGYVTCLRADDGALVWRFRAMPRNKLLYSYEQLESAWPIHGSVLVDAGKTAAGGRVYFAAGRSSHLDGGIRLYALDLPTGRVASEATVNKAPGADRDTTIRAGALPDILSMRDNSIFMRHLRFDKELRPQKQNVHHLYSPAGFLDTTWWHRTYWLFGTDMGSGWGGWPKRGNVRPAGRMLAYSDPSVIYGYGRMSYRPGGGHVGSDPAKTYKLFAEVRAQKAHARGKRTVEWSQQLPFVLRAMVLAEDAILLAGGDHLPGTGADEGTGVFRIVSREDGSKRFEGSLPSTPVCDGMALTDSGIAIATRSGKVVYLK